MEPGQNPYPYRVYVTQTKNGKELHAEFVSGHSMPSEAARSRENQAGSMTRGCPSVDAKGVTWDCVVRHEPYPEWP